MMLYDCKLKNNIHMDVKALHLEHTFVCGDLTYRLCPLSLQGIKVLEHLFELVQAC